MAGIGTSARKQYTPEQEAFLNSQMRGGLPFVNTPGQRIPDNMYRGGMPGVMPAGGDVIDWEYASPEQKAAASARINREVAERVGAYSKRPDTSVYGVRSGGDQKNYGGQAAAVTPSAGGATTAGDAAPATPLSQPVAPLSVDMPNERPSWAGGRGLYRSGGGGVFERLGDMLKQPNMSAALLRGAAAAFNGDGLGGSIMAAGNYMDQRRNEQAKLDQQDIENAQRDRGIDIQQQGVTQTGQHYERSDANDAQRTKDQGEYQRGSLANQRYNIDVDSKDRRYGIDVGSATTRRGQDLDFTASRERLGTTVSENAKDRTQRAEIAGIGSKAMAKVGRIKVAAVPEVKAKSHWFSADEPGSAASPAREIDIYAMPSDQKDLRPGVVYQTTKGPAIFNGSGFDPI